MHMHAPRRYTCTDNVQVRTCMGRKRRVGGEEKVEEREGGEEEKEGGRGGEGVRDREPHTFNV